MRATDPPSRKAIRRACKNTQLCPQLSRMPLAVLYQVALANSIVQHYPPTEQPSWKETFSTSG